MSGVPVRCERWGNGDRPDRAHERRRSHKTAWTDQFQVLVDCRDEREQKRLYEWLAANGYACRVLVM